MNLNKPFFIIGMALICFSSCRNTQATYDASGTFEATEVLISSEVGGVLKAFNLNEGDMLEAGSMIGYIDSTQLFLKKLQLEKSRNAVNSERPDVNKQLEALRTEVNRLKKEQQRMEKLVKGDAATQQQLDNINAQYQSVKAQLEAQETSLQNNVGSLNAQSSAIDIQIAQMEDQLSKCRLINPLKGTVLNKYAETFELVVPGKPLYKIADLQHMILRVYVTADQLANIKLNQGVSVYIENQKEPKPYQGKVVWISDQAEFTPKTAQTKTDRANLVYAVKIAVENDGYLKIGMYGKVSF